MGDVDDEWPPKKLRMLSDFHSPPFFAVGGRFDHYAVGELPLPQDLLAELDAWVEADVDAQMTGPQR